MSLKYLRKNVKFIISLVMLLLVAGTTILFLINRSYDEQIIQQKLEEEFVVGYSIYGSYFDYEFYDDYETDLVMTKFDLLNPVYSLVIYKDQESDFNPKFIFIAEMKRYSLSELKILEAKMLISGESSDDIINDVKEEDLRGIESYNGRSYRTYDIISQQEANQKSEDSEIKITKEENIENCLLILKEARDSIVAVENDDSQFRGKDLSQATQKDIDSANFIIEEYTEEYCRDESRYNNESSVIPNQ